MDWDPREFFSKIEWENEAHQFNLSFAMDGWEIDLAVPATSSDDADRLEQAAKFLVTVFENVDLFYRSISESLLQVYNESWRQGAELTDEDFADRITLQSMRFDHGDVTITFADDGLFGGHWIVVDCGSDAIPGGVRLEG